MFCLCWINETAAQASGNLSGSAATESGTISLTSSGTADWDFYDLGGTTTNQKKAGGTAVGLISGYTSISSTTGLTGYNTSNIFTWTDGTPTSSESASTGILTASGANAGAYITAPADVTTRVLHVYMGNYTSPEPGYTAYAKIVAHLSDSISTDYNVTTSIQGLSTYKFGSSLFYLGNGKSSFPTSK
jgi:hypothetical protein